MRKTVQIRAPRKLVEELRVKFPSFKKDTAGLIQIMYDTSLLKLESGLRRVNATKKK